MAEKRQRIDVSGGRETLGDNPFGRLASVQATQPEGLPKPPPKEAKAYPFKVRKTQKGGWPVRVEKRSGGKMATIIDRIDGDAEALCNLLKKKLATGGAAKDGGVELQGDHVKAVTEFLQSL